MDKTPYMQDNNEAGTPCECGHLAGKHARRRKNPGRGRCGAYLCTCREYVPQSDVLAKTLVLP